MSLSEIKKYNDTIIKDICNILKKNSVDYSASQSEVAIKNGDKEEICGFIAQLSIPKDALKRMVDVVKAKNTIYIRKKIKT